MQRLLFPFILMLSLVATQAVYAADPQPGRDFDKVAQVIPTDSADKIEVMELFWYGCPHCYHMEKPLSAWLKKLPKDVTFKRMPALPHPKWAPMAKAFFTMETLGLTDKLHHALFDDVHKNKKLNPTDEKATIAWLVNKSGLDRSKVEETYKSFSVTTNLNRAAQIFRSSGATGVPSLVVDGKYITSGTMAGGNENALAVTDYIIKNIRAAKAKPAAKK